MKRLTIYIGVLLIGAFVWADFGTIESIPVSKEPSLIGTSYQWDLTKAYYHKVLLPDGSKVELKSRTPLTENQWKTLATSVYIKPDVIDPKICPYCGQVVP